MRAFHRSARQPMYLRMLASPALAGGWHSYQPEVEEAHEVSESLALARANHRAGAGHAHAHSTFQSRLHAQLRAQERHPRWPQLCCGCS